MNQIFTNMLWPLALAQGLWLRRRVPRLPEAGGPTSGTIGQGNTIHVAIYGESPVAGVGIDSHQSGLGPSVALGLANEWKCAIAWRVVGRNGLMSRELSSLIKTDLNQNPTPDYAIICIGVNDSKGLTQIPHWNANLKRAKDLLHAARVTRVVFADVPALDQFPALPRPLSTLLGHRARRLNQALQAELSIQEATVPFTLKFDPELFAKDGFHPSAAGLARWGAQISNALIAFEGS